MTNAVISLLLIPPGKTLLITPLVAVRNLLIERSKDLSGSSPSDHEKLAAQDTKITGYVTDTAALIAMNWKKEKTVNTEGAECDATACPSVGLDEKEIMDAKEHRAAKIARHPVMIETYPCLKVFPLMTVAVAHPTCSPVV